MLVLIYKNNLDHLLCTLTYIHNKLWAGRLRPFPQSASPYSYKPYYYFTNTFFTEPLLYFTTLTPLVGVSSRLPFVVYR